MMFTLSTLHLASIQDVFNQAARHLLTQKEKATIYNQDLGIEACQYKNPEGLRCAFGCFVSDDEYTNLYEGNAAYFVIEDFENSNPEIPKTGELVKDFCNALQDIHDSYAAYEWHDKLTELADEYSLVMPEVEDT